MSSQERLLSIAQTRGRKQMPVAVAEGPMGWVAYVFIPMCLTLYSSFASVTTRKQYAYDTVMQYASAFCITELPELTYMRMTSDKRYIMVGVDAGGFRDTNTRQCIDAKARRLVRGLELLDDSLMAAQQ
jgi:hypothetical protein